MRTVRGSDATAIPRPAGYYQIGGPFHFNMHRAGSVGDSTVVVVEGFFDCMKLHQASFRSVVALMGSVLYEPQGHALPERFLRVILLLDGDATGRKASTVVAQTYCLNARSEWFCYQTVSSRISCRRRISERP